MGQVMTAEQKTKLHEMLYYNLLRKRGGSNVLRCYLAAANQANYILAAIGEKLDEDYI